MNNKEQKRREDQAIEEYEQWARDLEAMLEAQDLHDRGRSDLIEPVDLDKLDEVAIRRLTDDGYDRYVQL